MTEKLFYRDSHMRFFEAEVVSCRRAGTDVQMWKDRCDAPELWETVLDRTAFFPEGGGQYGDRGRLDDARVFDAQEVDGVIFHLTDRPFEPAARVKGELDWEERFMKMQQHTGEHIVSGLVHSWFGYRNVGFHLGSSDCTMDYSGELSADQLQEIETAANRAVWENLNVYAFFPSAEEREGLAYRSKIEIEGAVRIVEIPGYDVCACCAPHVNFTGEIGLIRLTGVQRYKGGARVTMVCGERALSDCRMKEQQNREISAMLCARESETAGAVRHLQQEYGAVKYRITDLEKKMAGYQAEMVPEGEKTVCFFLESSSGESMRIFLNKVLEKERLLCAVFCGSEEEGYRYVIGSRAADVRPLAKAFHEAFCGKGGGKPEMVQGSVRGNPEEMKAWIFEKAEELL